MRGSAPGPSGGGKEDRGGTRLPCAAAVLPSESMLQSMAPSVLPLHAQPVQGARLVSEEDPSFPTIALASPAQMI
jgi:hypothetical protein